MATNGKPLENGHAFSDDISLCGECKKTFVSPRSLPCLHTFCSACLEAYIKKSIGSNGQRFFHCPTCDMEIDVPNDALPGQYAASFPMDSFMEKLVELVAATSFDKMCDICVRREEKVAAQNWCMDCFDALCDPCFKVHVHGKTTSNHVVFRSDELRLIPLENLMKKKNKVPCGKHNETITLFCVDCREPLCVQCMAVSHRRCENVITVADAMTSRTDVKDIMDRLDSLKDSVHGTNGLGENDQILESSIDSARIKIVSVCDSLIEKVREEQDKLLRQLDDTAYKARKILKGRIEPRKSGSKTIQAAHERMKILMKYGSDVDILLAYNQVKKQLDSCQGSVAELDPKNMVVKVNFDLAENVDSFMQEFKAVGNLSIDDSSDDIGLSSWGVTCTHTDDIIVTDCKNRRIQKFSKFGDLVDYVQLEDEPRDITTIGRNDDVAITLVGKLIIFLSTRKSMQLLKRAKTERQYDGIAFSFKDSFLVVSSIRDCLVDIIQLGGEVIRSIHSDTVGSPLFREPRYVAVSPDGAIVVSDVEQGTVISFDNYGRVLSQYRPESGNGLKKPQGVSVDKIGNIFVADNGNNRVQLCTNDGVFQRNVLGHESGLDKPVAIEVSSSNRMIIVQNDGMVKVFSYS